MEICEELHKFFTSEAVKRQLEKEGKTVILKTMAFMEGHFNTIQESKDQLREAFSRGKNKEFLEQVREINKRAVEKA